MTYSKWSKQDSRNNKYNIDQAKTKLEQGNCSKAKYFAGLVTTTTYYDKKAKSIIAQAKECQYKNLLELAQKSHDSGDLMAAIEQVKEIPQDASVYPDANHLLTQWKSKLKSDIEKFIKHYFEEDLNRQGL